MNRNFQCTLLCLAALAIGGPALADGAGPCGISTNVRADGTVELSNTGNVAKCETPAAAPRPPSGAASDAASAPAKAAPGAGAAAAASAANPPAPPLADARPAPSDQPKDPRETYRDAMLQGAAGTTAANPAVSRRYKMMDKATYQAAVLGGGSPGSQADSAAIPTPAQ
jgi:hypothetical protein